MTQSQRRIAALQEILRGQQQSGALFASSASFAYLLGLNRFPFQRTSQTKNQRGAPVTEALNVPDCLLWIPARGQGLVLTVPWRRPHLEGCPLPVQACCLDTFGHALRRALEGSSFAIGENCAPWLTETLEELVPDCRLTNGEPYCLRLRRYKDDQEISLLRRAAQITDLVMGQVVERLDGTMTPWDVEELLARLGREQGAEDLAFSPGALFTKTDHPSADSILGYPRDMALSPGSSIAFDFGYVLEGYCSDFGRSFYYGKAPGQVREGYLALQQAQVKMIESIVPGRTNIQELDGLVRQELHRLGFGSYMTNAHNGVIGHQIGMDCHEFPWLNRSVDFVLQPGMVFCTEPKMWFPHQCYMRVEDMVLVTDTGAVSLTQYDREQFELPLR